MTQGDAAATSSGEPPTRSRGGSRRLDPDKDEAIVAAVHQLLAEVGYNRLTMDDVAMTAGVGKAAIYRRWSSKADLLVAYTEKASRETLEGASTGSLRDDLVTLLTSVVQFATGPTGRANRSLLSMVHDDPRLFASYRHGPLDRWSAAFADVFGQAVERGELTPEAGTSLAAEAGPAILLSRWLVSGRTLDENLARTVVDEVMMPLLRRFQTR